MQLAVTLPVPPSTNRIWRNVNGRTLLSAQARDYLKESGWLIKEAAAIIGWDEQPTQRYRIELVLHFGSKQRRDISNRVKILEDSASAALGFDDSQIDELVVRRGAVDKANPRVELTVATLGQPEGEAE